MRRFLIRSTIVLLPIVAMAITWLFAGPQISSFVDTFWTIEVSSEPVKSIRYEGSGTGGNLRINELALNLTPSTAGSPIPSVGSTKDGQLALAVGGKVFAFGPLPKSADDNADVLATAPQSGDNAVISVRHSALGWPTPLELNLMTGQSPTWKRYLYQRLTWKRPGGSKLEMVWRYEQYFYALNGWTAGTMTREGVTGLIQVDLQP